jgi:hypothetical protein
MKAVWAIWIVGILLADYLCCLEHPPQLDQPSTELVPLDSEGNDFVQPRPMAEVGADLVMRQAEPYRFASWRIWSRQCTAHNVRTRATYKWK